MTVKGFLKITPAVKSRGDIPDEEKKKNLFFANKIKLALSGSEQKQA